MGLFDTVAQVTEWLVRVAQAMPYAASVALVVVGLIVAVVGSRPPIVRVVAFVAGAALGFGLADLPASYFHMPQASVQYALAGGLSLLGAAFPEAIVFVVLGGLAGILSAYFFPPGDRAVAFVPGFLIGGVIGAIFAPWITAGLTGLMGGLGFAVGLAGTLPKATGGAWLLAHPLALLGLGLAVGASGVAGQLSLPDEEARLAGDAELARKREVRKQDKARDKRFREYARKGRDPK